VKVKKDKNFGGGFSLCAPFFYAYVEKYLLLCHPKQNMVIYDFNQSGGGEVKQ